MTTKWEWVEASEETKKCPFCGKMPMFYKPVTNGLITYRGAYKCFTETCPARSMAYSKEWQTRVSDE